MKSISFICILLPIAFYNGYSQDHTFLMKDGSIYVELIDTTLAIKKEAIHQYTKQWIAKSFGSSKAVIDMDDPNSGTIIIKFLFDTKSIEPTKSGEQVLVRMNNKATMQIDSRNGKIRIRTSDFQWAIDLSAYTTVSTIEYTSVDKAVKELIAKGETIQTIANIGMYKQVHITVENLCKDLVKFIKQSAKDEF